MHVELNVINIIDLTAKINESLSKNINSKILIMQTKHKTTTVEPLWDIFHLGGYLLFTANIFDGLSQSKVTKQRWPQKGCFTVVFI